MGHLSKGKTPSRAQEYNADTAKTQEEFVKKVVRQEQRDNRGYAEMSKDLKKDGYLLLDSSYTQACNPNTMRNFGPTRNVVYNFEAHTDPTSGWSEGQAPLTSSSRANIAESEKAVRNSRRSVRTQDVDIAQPRHQDLGSYGDIKKEAKAGASIDRKKSGAPAEAGSAESQQEEEGQYDDWFAVVKANDCTKNISEPLFSAGLLESERFQQVSGNTPPQGKTGSGQKGRARALWRDGAIRLNEQANKQSRNGPLDIDNIDPRIDIDAQSHMSR